MRSWERVSFLPDWREDEEEFVAAAVEDGVEDGADGVELVGVEGRVAGRSGRRVRCRLRP